jgi:dihydropyrimidinase
MAYFDLILRNACVNGAFVCDIGVKNGIIAALSLGLEPSVTTKVIECDGTVTPGGIDGHVHLAQDRSAHSRLSGFVCADTSELSCGRCKRPVDH